MKNPMKKVYKYIMRWKIVDYIEIEKAHGLAEGGRAEGVRGARRESHRAPVEANVLGHRPRHDPTIYITIHLRCPDGRRGARTVDVLCHGEEEVEHVIVRHPARRVKTEFQS